jgi:ribosomal protein S18 acetylase RimI-like enzyme
MEAFVIEPGSVEDLDLLEPLWVAVHHQQQKAMPELRPYVDDTATWRERRALYTELFAQRDPVLLLARDGDQLIGYALGYTMPAAGTWLADTWVTGALLAEVESLSVLPAYRGRGLGSRLLEELHERLRDQGANDLILGVLAGNTEARRLYERLGYHPTWLYMTRLEGRPEPG